MITLAEYFAGRDKKYSNDLTKAIVSNANITVYRANLILTEYYKANPTFSRTNKCNSGWRPPAVNAATQNSAKSSKHLTGSAIDISDDGRFSKWLMSSDGLQHMKEIGLWMEHPKDTPTWCHLQIVPPNSKLRIFNAR